MGRIKQIWPVKCPEYRAEMHRWMVRPDRDGASSMMAYLVGDVQDLLESGPSQTDQAQARGLARRHAASLEIADLFHITNHKMPEVIEAAGKLPLDLGVRRHWFHTDHGVMFFEKGYTTKAFDDRAYEWKAKSPNETRVMALSWSITGEVISILAWTETDSFMRLAMEQAQSDWVKDIVGGPLPTRQEVNVRMANIGPLMVCGQLTVRLSDYMRQISGNQGNTNLLEGENYNRHTMAVLLSGCLMLRQYTTAASVVEAPRSSWRRIQRMNPDLGTRVTVIDKRTIKPNPTKEVGDEAAPKRQLTVRYDRRGHWREYKSERFSPELREHPIWIPAHWVGHEGLPMVRREKVIRLKR